MLSFSLSFLFCLRQIYYHLESAEPALIRADGRAVAVGYLLCYREAESASVFVTRPRLVASVESFEYLIALVRRDTLTVVFNRYFGVSVFAVSDGKHYFSRSVLRAVFAAVVDKIVEHAPELGGIDIYLPVLVALEVIYELYARLAEGVGDIGGIFLEEVLRLYLLQNKKALCQG